MKKAKIINFTMLIIAVILQAVTFCDNPSGYYENGFAVGISNLNKHYDVALSLIYVMLPFAFILFLFGGTVQDIKANWNKYIAFIGCNIDTMRNFCIYKPVSQ